MIKISIIIPVYNNEEIGKCIDSILAQDYKDFELIIINDGSKDNTEKVCLDYSKKDERIKIKTVENGGVSKARNIGIKEANGEYIVFIDSDDIITENYLSNLLSKNPNEKKLVRTGIKFVDKNKEKTENINITNIEQYKNDVVTGKIQGFIVAYIFNRKTIGKIRFNEKISFMEDILFLLEYLDKIEEIEYADNSFYKYINNMESVTKKQVFKEKIYINIKEVFDILINNYPNQEKELKIRKIKILESELAKCYSMTEIKKMINNDNVREIILEMSKFEDISKVHKRIFKMVLNKNRFGFRIYVVLRRILKFIKGVL